MNKFINYTLAFILGISVTLALPPLHLLPLAIIGFSGFFIMITACSSASMAFKLGWWFGFGHFTAGLYWIAFALLVDAAQFGWLIPFALFGIPAVIAIYIGLVALIVWKIGRYITGWRQIVMFAITWTAMEMLRGWLFTGFPWNLVGYIWAASSSMLQITSITGIWGLSLVTVLTFSLPALMKDLKSKYPHPIIIGTLILLTIFIYGAIRLQNDTQYVENVKLRIVQANIPQSMKWDEEWNYKTVHKYLAMSQSTNIENITHIIWPETALPFVISESSPLLEIIGQITPENGAIITGALRAEYTASGVIKQMWNSLIVVTKSGQMHSYYDKSHLVPFGEYVPFRNFLPLDKITHGSMDFANGNGAKTITAPGLPDFGALVCYEVIFPGQVVEKNNPPKAIINVTNDAWYGNTSGPYQHFQMSRVRAIEEGTPLIRAANNGISGVIDSYGRIIKQTKLSSEAVLDVSLPTSIRPTLYSSYGNSIILLIMAAMAVITYISLGCVKIRLHNFYIMLFKYN